MKHSANRHNFYKNRNQHDAHEFFSDLLNDLQLESEENNLGQYLGNSDMSQGTSSTALNAIMDNNSIWLTSFLLVEKISTCVVCETKSMSHQTSDCLQIQVREDQADLTIQKDNEVIVKACNYCKENQEHLRKYEITTAPVLLLIQIKRFEYNHGRVTKTTSAVQIEEMELAVGNSIHLYTPEAVICHHGTDNNGHYTCWIKEKDEWWRISDESISKSARSPTEAYLLMYRHT